MFVAYVVVTVITIIANTAVAVADFGRAPFVLANSAEVGVPPAWLPLLATLKAAGAAGLLIGLFGGSSVGIAAAVGLVAFFTGALVAHVRAGVFHNIAFPGAYWLLATGCLGLAIAQ